MTSEKATTLAEAVGHRFDSIFANEDDPTPAGATLVDTVTMTSFQSPIIDLKSIIMSIEWEITDRLMDRLHREVTDLTALYRGQAIPSQLLKIMDALGKYINHRQADAHPDSIKLMSLAFNNFEAVVENTDMPKAKQQELLQVTVRDFKRLKQQIAATVQEGKTPSSDQAVAEAAAPPQPASPPAQEAQPSIADTATITAEPQPIGQAAQEVRSDASDTPPEPTGPGLSSDSEPQPMATSPDYQAMTPHEAFAVAVEELKTLIRAEFSALRAEIRMWREGQ